MTIHCRLCLHVAKRSVNLHRKCVCPTTVPGASLQGKNMGVLHALSTAFRRSNVFASWKQGTSWNVIAETQKSWKHNDICRLKVNKRTLKDIDIKWFQVILYLHSPSTWAQLWERQSLRTVECFEHLWTVYYLWSSNRNKGGSTKGQRKASLRKSIQEKTLISSPGVKKPNCRCPKLDLYVRRSIWNTEGSPCASMSGMRCI